MDKPCRKSFVLAVFLCHFSFYTALLGDSFTVLTTSDSGPGSLRVAIGAASGTAGADTIRFGIPLTDPGYNPATRVWVIKPNSTYNVPAAITIDARIALAGSGFRAGIEIDGTILAQSGMTGFRLSEGAELHWLVVNRCQYGIWIDKANAIIKNCYIGTDPTGLIARPNNGDGILLANGAARAIIQDNLISGNSGNGIRLFGEATAGNIIYRNRIGTNVDGTEALFNGYGGIIIQDGPHDNIFEKNLISGNMMNGVEIYGAKTHHNLLRNNFIGTGAEGKVALANGADGLQVSKGTHDNVIEQNLISGNGGNGISLSQAGTIANLIRYNRVGTDSTGIIELANRSFGVFLFKGACHNTIGPKNVIAFNNRDGVLTDGADSLGNTIGNTITSNSIYANNGKGIYNYRKGNIELPAPTIVKISVTEVSGTVKASLKVEAFADQGSQGKTFLGSTTADQSGHFYLKLLSPPTLPSVTTTATDSAGNTSEFSVPMITGTDQPAQSAPIPQNCELCQNYPNPFNPTTTIEFSLTETEQVSLKILTLLGQQVANLIDGRMAAGTHKISWNAGDQGNGVYFYILEAGNYREVRMAILMK
jgi:hypothetical protein